MNNNWKFLASFRNS